MRHHTELQPIAHKLWGDALVGVNFNYAHRAHLTELLMREAEKTLTDRREREWCVSYGLSKSGYGGGL